MKTFRVLALVLLCAFGVTVFLLAQQGPKTDGSETVARPRKPGTAPNAPAEPDQPKIPSKFGKPKDGDLPDGATTFKSDVVTVSVDAAVLDTKGHFIPKLPKNYFRILEDGVPQQVTGFTVGEAPMTICMVIEFSNQFQQFYSEGWFETLSAAYGFVQTLKPEDYVAIVAYDLRSERLSDFTTDRQQTAEALSRLRLPGFSESGMYDAVVDTAQRMQDIEGRKAIVLIASGIDTFSKLTYDKARRAIQDAGVPIYTIGLLQAGRAFADGSGMLGSTARLDFLQADNQMRTFASETGGMSFFPRFQGEYPAIFRSVAEAMRNEYVLSYNPSNQARDGKVRKIKVQLIDPETNQPLRVNDEKGKAIKYQIVAKPGYTAPHEVE